MSILNVAAYKFVDLDDLPALRTQLREAAAAQALKGTILLAPEGINLFLAGVPEKLEAFLAQLLADPRFAGMPVKRSYSAEQPFNRMLVKIKREIITMRRPEIRPAQQPAPRIAPRELKRWLDEGREVVLLDTRNAFEVAVGTFEGAQELGLRSFSQFPAEVEKRLEDWRDKPVVTFCTGGIRCEKAAPLMQRLGFREVYQLDGGILQYFEDCGGAHWRGECFVFDKRVALDPQLRETATTQCYACQAVLTPEDQQSPDYVVGVSCPKCAAQRRAA
ncbi:MAG: sulfurtransferase [Burkholderiales bacterium]|nr:sulfurtransferase [Burkholderiales bacterium]PZN01396.1 MAG: sulfurtransferase [Pseudomonadota bacterium]